MFTKARRFLGHAAVWLFVTAPLELIGIPLLAIVLLFVPKDRQYLPRWCRWYDNHEYHMYGPDYKFLDGLAGPDYYIQERQIDLDNYWSRYKARLNWLAIRNPANYFHYYVIGRKMDNKSIRVHYNPPLTDIDKVGGSIIASTLDNKVWEYYYIIPYSFWKGRGLRLRWGWKISSSHRSVQQWVFVVNPFFYMK